MLEFSQQLLTLVFSRTVQAKIFKYGIYICRMSDYIVGLRLKVMAFIFLYLSIVLSLSTLHVNIRNLCWSFLRNF